MASCQNVLLVGPDPRGLGGIETVIRTYLEHDFEGLEFHNLATWDKTTPGANTKFLWPITLSRLLFSARNYREKRTIVHAHVSHNGSFAREGSYVIAAMLIGLPSRVTIHGSAFVSSAQGSKLKRIMYSLVLRCADRVAVLNDGAATMAKSLGAREVVTLANPGPVRRRLLHTPAGENPPLVVFAGTVGRRKGADILNEAWSRVVAVFPEAELEVYGPEGDRDVVADLGSNWRGPVAPHVVWNALKRCRVAVLPSTAEAMPMFIMEALGHGRPVVVTDVGAMAAQASGSGTVIPVGDADALAQAILAYFRSPEIATLHGDAGITAYHQNQDSATSDHPLRDFYAATSSNRGK